MNNIPRKLEKAMEKLSPQLQSKMAEANEMVLDIGHRLMRDQVEWLDKQMQDLLPPNLYAAGLEGQCESLIAQYMEQHKIRIIFVPDRLVLRIMLGDKVHSQFVTQLAVDGEKVDWDVVSTPFKPEQN